MKRKPSVCSTSLHFSNSSKLITVVQFFFRVTPVLQWFEWKFDGKIFAASDRVRVHCSCSCVWPRLSIWQGFDMLFAWLNVVLYLTGEGRITIEWRYFECPGTLLLNEIIWGWSWIIIFVEWNYFWWNLIWTNIFVEWKQFGLKLNKYWAFRKTRSAECGVWTKFKKKIKKEI